VQCTEVRRSEPRALHFARGRRRRAAVAAGRAGPQPRGLTLGGPPLALKVRTRRNPQLRREGPRNATPDAGVLDVYAFSFSKAPSDKVHIVEFNTRVSRHWHRSCGPMFFKDASALCEPEGEAP
jgi:hypothetical protein